ncbi:unnamed protein product [Caenorhabditis angaria]|uniref:Ku domain-containing protein n=1 Tax=Caenorhabditis angaria TaxID=860376 RepID=A0A9P1IIN1_9PELO|nr:unnamed protein product [Caenorhabditis angaria]
MPPKSKQYGVTVVLVDVGANIAEDIEKSRTTADWIFSRKLFSNSEEKLAVAAFNSSITQNSMNLKNVQLKFINNELEVNKNYGDIYNGVSVAIDMIETHERDHDGFVNDRTIVVITNSNTEYLKQEKIDLLAEKLAGIDIIIIGQENTQENPLTKFIEEVNAQVYTYDFMLKNVSVFMPKITDTRNMYKQFEIAPDIRLPLAFTTKSAKSTSSGLKFSLVDDYGSNVVRVSQLNVQNENGETQTFAQLPKAVFEKNCEEETSFIVETETSDEIPKDEVCSGYFFGKTLIFFDDDEIKSQYNNHNFNDGEKGGCLKLIQFTKKENIDPSFFLGDKSYTVMPSVSKTTSGNNLNTTRCTLALIESMFELEVVAICRYAYSVSSHLQLMALIPHFDEENEVAFLRAVRLPFVDDMRCLKFPTFEKSSHDMMFLTDSDETKPTVAHLSAIDDLIDLMQFDETTVNTFTTGQMPDPQLQLQCHFLRDKILKPDISTKQHLENAMEKVDEFMKPINNLVEANGGLFKRLSEEFNLNRVVKEKRQRIELDKQDMQNLIDEYKNKKNTEKEKKTGGNKKEDLESKFEKDATNSAIEACKGAIKTIGAMCLIPDKMSREQCFEVIHTQILEIRQLCIKYNIFETFNEFLLKLREEEDYEEFRDFLAENKLCFPISQKDLKLANLSENEAIEFWDE